jgi:hypothetical protein
VLRVAIEAAEEGLVASSVRIEVGRGVDADAGGRPELMGADDGRVERVCAGTETLVPLTTLVALDLVVALPSVVLVAVAATEETSSEGP